MTTQTKKSWRDVPMPPKIAAMDRDPRGFPIGHIAMRYPVLVPPKIDSVLGFVACEDRNGELELDLGHMSEERQRDCWFNYRCQVCYADLRRKKRYLAGGVDDNALDDFLFREPYVCGTCLGYALQVCPGLVTGAKKNELRVVHVTTEPRFYAERIGADGEMRMYRIGFDLDTICFYLRAQFGAGTIMMPDEFLKSWRAS